MLAGQMMGDANLDCQSGFHVTRTPAVHVSVSHLSAERINCPEILVVDRHGIQMAVQDQSRTVTTALQDGPDGWTPGHRLDELGLDRRAVEPTFDPPRYIALIGSRISTGGPHQVSEHVGDVAL